MSDSKPTFSDSPAAPEWNAVSRAISGASPAAAGKRSLQLWNLLSEASEIIDDIGTTLRSNRDQARENARAAADATSPEAKRLIELVRDMHSHALQDSEQRREPANRMSRIFELEAEVETEAQR